MRFSLLLALLIQPYDATLQLRVSKPSVWGQAQTTPFITVGYPDPLQTDPNAFNINMREVMAFASTSFAYSATNMVTSASTMSSTMGGYPVTLCTDGITNTAANFCSTGAGDTEPWWLTNALGAPLGVVQIWPRVSTLPCCPGRMAGALISAEASLYGRGVLPFWGTKLNNTVAQLTVLTFPLPLFTLRISRPTGAFGQALGWYAPASSSPLLIALAEVAAFDSRGNPLLLNASVNATGTACLQNRPKVANSFANICEACTDGNAATTCESGAADLRPFLLFSVTGGATPAAVALTPSAAAPALTGGLLVEVLSGQTGGALWGAYTTVRTPPAAQAPPVVVPAPPAASCATINLAKPAAWGPWWDPATSTNQPALNFAEIQAFPGTFYARAHRTRALPKTAQPPIAPSHPPLTHLAPPNSGGHHLPNEPCAARLH